METQFDEARHVTRLREEQEKAIFETTEKITTLQKFRNDYLALKERLKTLPDKVAHDVMVPFGKLAFMPGKLVHTNEILVLLGDNWFAEKSAKESCETIDRRMRVLDKQITDLEKQKGLLEPRLSFTSELEDMAQAKGNVKEIKEEYNPEKEKLWKVEHKKKVQTYNRQRREEEKQARLKYEEQEKTAKMTDQDLWDRLDQLEKQEEKHNEIDGIGIEEENSDDDESDDDETTSSSSDSGNGEDGQQTKIRWKDKSKSKIVNFKHASSAETIQTKTSNNIKEEPDSKSPAGIPVINSPGDIFRHFIQSKGPKSILKTKSLDQLEVADDPIGSSDKLNLQSTDTVKSAFTGEVQERVPSSLQASNETILASNETSSDNTTITENPAPKRVSKFKAQRIARK